MASFEERIKAACEAREIPGVVVYAEDKTGKFKYENAFGPKSATEPMSLDTTFIMASCTKLITSISAMQCVERGQIALDDDLSTILPELKDIEIITDFEERSKKPTFKKAENKITLRHLLTHSSGITYDGMHPLVTQWRREVQGYEPGIRGVPFKDRLQVPLLFEPGTSWIYGMSIDWAGLLVMRLNNTSLEEYMQKNIWTPLGIENITFHYELKPEVKKNLVTMTQRDGIENPRGDPPVDTGKPVIWSDMQLYDDPIPMGEEMGGQGCTGSAGEYFKILKSLLLNDSKLLKPATLELMFTPQLNDDSRAGLIAFVDAPYFKDTFASHPSGTKLDHGLGGLLVLEDEKTGVRKGTLTWSGLPNLLWRVDREAGLATFYASNVIPFGDPKSHVWQQEFEKEMYARLGSSSKL